MMVYVIRNLAFLHFLMIYESGQALKTPPEILKVCESTFLAVQ